MVSLIFISAMACQNNPSKEQDLNLLGLIVSPDSLIVSVGETTQLKAIGLTETHESINLTASVEWNVEYYSVATISNSLDSEGILTAQGEGISRIYADYNGLKSPYAEVVVTESELERLTVTPNNVDIRETEKVQLTATGYFSNGQSGDVTGQCRWITSNGTIVQFDAPGLIDAISPGVANVVAVLDETESDAVEVMVAPAVDNGRPDLIITEETEGRIEGGKIKLTVKVKNQGTQGASGFWVDVFVNNEERPQINDLGDEFSFVEYLGINHYKLIDIEIPVNNGNPADIWILADTNNEIEESHENNNAYNLTVSEVEDPQQEGLADLEISNILVSINPSNDTTTYEIEVRNSGNAKADYFYVDLFPNQSTPPAIMDDGEKYIGIEELAAGETQSASITLSYACGNCTSWGMIDGYDFVVESDETNNIFGPVQVN